MTELATSLAAAQAGQLAGRQPDTVLALVQRLRPQIEIALPETIGRDRFMRVTMTELRHNPRLLECSQASLLESLLRAAQLGLEPGGPLQEAHLVPFRNPGGGFDCVLIIDYRGEIKLARRSGEIADIDAHTVYRNDTFRVAYGLQPVLEHVPTLFGEPGEAYAWYALARFTNGGHVFQVLPKWEVERRRKRSRATGQDSPWQRDYDAMGNKSAIHALAKYLPLTAEARGAIADEEAQEYGGDDSNGAAFMTGAPTPSLPAGYAPQVPAGQAELTPAAPPETPGPVAPVTPPAAVAPPSAPRRRGRPPRRQPDDGGMYGPDGGPAPQEPAPQPQPQAAPEGPGTPRDEPPPQTSPPGPPQEPTAADTTGGALHAAERPVRDPAPLSEAQRRTLWEPLPTSAPYKDRTEQARDQIDAFAKANGSDQTDRLIAAVTGKQWSELSADEVIRVGSGACEVHNGRAIIADENGIPYLTIPQQQRLFPRGGE
jgi:recombination protein RecT